MRQCHYEAVPRGTGSGEVAVFCGKDIMANLKIESEHIAHLKAEIEAHAELVGGIMAVAGRYERGEFPRSDAAKDLQKRFCFDMLFAVPGLCAWVCRHIYCYSHDEHLYSALKSFMPKVERKY